MDIYQKQTALGFIGLALLRKKLLGDRNLIDKFLKDASTISGASVANNAKNIVKFPLKKGYKTWVNSYDEGKNILIEAEDISVRSILKNINSGGIALDVACGTGRYSKFLKKLGYEVVGTDVSEDMLKVARRKVKGVNFLNADTSKLPFSDRHFDLVVCGLGLNQTKK